MDKFGELGKKIMADVRDASIEEHFKIKTGQLKSEEALDMHKAVSQLGSRDLEILDKTITQMIDRVIDNMLWMFETSGSLTIADKETIPNQSDIVEFSDGLSGELYGKNGWISLFSKYPE